MFVEDEGDIVFFKNQRGEALRDCAEAQSGKEGEDEAYRLAGL